MHKSQHIRNDFDQRCCANRSHVEYFFAHRLHCRFVKCDQCLIATGQECQLASRRQMHAAGDGQF